MGNERIAVIGEGSADDELCEHFRRLGAAQVDAFGPDFWETLTLGRLQDYACAVGVLDDIESKLRLNQICLIAAVDLVAVAFDGSRAIVECYPFGSSPDRACLECNLPGEAYRRIAERYSPTGLRGAGLTAFGNKSAGLEPKGAGLPAHGAAGAAVAAAFDLRKDARPPARRALIDSVSGTNDVVRLERTSACPGCEPFQVTPRIVRTRNRWCQRVDGVPGDRRHVDQHLRLSDGLITRYECTACGPLPEAARYVNRRADDFDESIARCARCGSASVQVEIRDTFRLGELMDRFDSAPVPAKYALIDSPLGPVCIDLEGDAT
jgi:hypothetical protein